MRTNGMTRRLQLIEGVGAPAPERFDLADGRYVVRVANDLESRRKAYRLIHRLYLRKEYARPNASGLWLSAFDALPETATLLVERKDTREAVGALTVVFDSSAGVPADGLYRQELDVLRAGGRRIAEVTSLGVAEEAEAASEVLVRLFNFAYFIARGIRSATDFVVTVNPRHAGFYERLMLFAAAGPERAYGKVGGAPAVLLRLDFDLAERERSLARAEPAAGRRRSIYGRFLAVGEARELVAVLIGQLRPMSGAELLHFLVVETDLLARAAPALRARLRECRPVYEALR